MEPPPLRDGGLELVEPSPQLIGDFVKAVSHPECTGEPACQITAATLRAYLKRSPRGREKPSPGRSATCTFWMRLHPAPGSDMADPPVPIAGTISLRIGNDENLRRYIGHIGYLVFPPARGHHLAERSVRLLLPLARRYGMREVWITANPDNAPSRRTCERVGARFVDVVDVPPGHPLHERGERTKARYRIQLEA